MYAITRLKSSEINHICIRIDSVESKINKLLSKINDLDNKSNAYLSLKSSQCSNECQSKFEAIEKKLNYLQEKIDKPNPAGSDDENDICYQLAENVTAIVGLREAVTSKHKTLKWIWAFLLCMGVGATGFYIYETGQEYLQHRTATNVRLERNASYAFPPLVMCPHVFLDVDKVNSSGLSMNALKYSLGYFDDYHRMQVPNASHARAEFANYYSSRFTSVIDYFKNVSIDWRRSKSEKDFAKSEVPSYFCSNCDASKQMEKIFTGDGVCYRFFLSMAQGGLGSPWNTILAKTLDDSRAEIIYAEKFSNWYVYFSAGFYLDPAVTPFLILEPYRSTVVKLTVKNFTTLRKPCAKLSEVGENYSSFMCMAKCENEIYMQKLKCKLWLHAESEHKNLSEFCNFYDDYENKTFERFYTSKECKLILETTSAVCFEKCSYKCERKLYEVSLVSQLNMSKTDYQTLVEPALRQNMSLVQVKIIHSAVNEGGILTYVEVDTYSFIEFVNNVGGTLGLFVGGTVMTLVQLTFFFVRYIVEKLRKI